MKKKGINEKDQFLFSLHRDELIGIVRKEGKPYYYDASTENKGEGIVHDGIHPEILKFTATNDDEQNAIEVKPFYTYPKKQKRITIATVNDLKKYATNAVGDLYEVKENRLKLEFD